jgi:hypothetical protein
MKKILLFLFVTIVSFNSFSQTTDSVTMLPGNALDVYYNLSTGHKDTVRNNNWHIAFSVRKAQPPLKTMQAATVLVNDGRGVDVFRSNKTVADWNNFDTAGWAKWPQTVNSDSTWDVGALNKIRNFSNPFDYGWGEYDMASKDVTGNQIWIMAISVSPNPNAPKMLKKFAVQRIVYDTMWVFTFSNIDGTDSNTVTIKKTDFGNKLFAYYNILSKTVIDREPALNTWDILFTRYKALVTLYGQTLMYPVMGVLHNPIATAAKYVGPDAKTIIPDSSLRFKTNINQLGWDWKYITTTPGSWPIRDSVSYVVKTGMNSYYRIYFTSYYSDQTRQNITFNKTFYSVLTGTESVSQGLQSLLLFPNPANEWVNLELNLNSTVSNLTIEIMDITGRVIKTEKHQASKGVFSAQIETNSLQSGVYFLSVSGNGNRVSKKFIVN